MSGEDYFSYLIIINCPSKVQFIKMCKLYDIKKHFKAENIFCPRNKLIKFESYRASKVVDFLREISPKKVGGLHKNAKNVLIFF